MSAAPSGTGDIGRWALVAVDGAPAHLDRGVLTYDVPEGTALTVGHVVWAPLRRGLSHGVVMGFTDAEPPFPTRPLQGAVEPEIILSDDQLGLATWMARETASPTFACAALFLPPGRAFRATEVYSLADPMPSDSREVTALQRKVLDALADGERTIDALRSATGRTLTTVMADLLKAGLVERSLRPEEHVPRPRTVRMVRLLDPDVALPANATRQAEVLSVIQHLRPKGDEDRIPLSAIQAETDVPTAALEGLASRRAIEVTDVPIADMLESRAATAPRLTEEQATAWRVIEDALEERDPTPNLLYGVTGSGKTEIYLRAVARCMRDGLSALILVPEIALAAQVVRRFVDRFPDRVAIMHSRMTPSERYDLWMRIRSGDIPVVVGPRSALFTPVQDLGLIVLDEEHDASYKQDNEPRYHARAVAAELARLRGAVVVFGSATPATESMWRAKQGVYRLLELRDRVGPIADASGSQRLTLPDVDIVDLRAELRAGHASLLSRELMAQVTRSLDRNEQSIVLLNRRGMSTIVLCREHGHRVSCPNCDIPLIYHGDRREMICHRCNYRSLPPAACPQCGSRLDFLGAGTQRVEESVRQAFPRARVMRWDQDSVRAQGGLTAMLERVERGDVDIIVGTQMVSKGFDLPRVTTIGVVQADSMLYLPDFRSAERTFQLLTQVAGRAGRRGPGSRVVFQTYTPEHYAVQAASRHDYDGFYRDEIAFREEFRFPPALRMVRFMNRDAKEETAALEADQYANELAKFAWRNGFDLELLGPTPAFVAKIRNHYQWQIVLRSTELESMLDSLPLRPGWVVDVDPESML